MDHQKTGTLIAQRRNQLGLTQKALAQQLNISDRAVSKWERGAGFPDISLIEPLADALGLTVLELLHGEQAPPTPEEERSVRETLNTFRPGIKETRKRARRWIIALAALLLATVSALFWTVTTSGPGEWIAMEVTAAQATATSPYILITGQDQQLLAALRQDEAISCHLSSVQGEVVTLDEEIAATYRKMADLPGISLEFLLIQVTGQRIHLEYGNNLIHCALSSMGDGSIEKTITAHETPYRTEDGLVINPREHTILYRIRNLDNETFRRGMHQ